MTAPKPAPAADPQADEESENNCWACRGRGYFDAYGKPTWNAAGRDCLECNGTGTAKEPQQSASSAQGELPDKETGTDWKQCYVDLRVAYEKEWAAAQSLRSDLALAREALEDAKVTIEKQKDYVVDAANRCLDSKDRIDLLEWKLKQFQNYGTDGCAQCETGRVSLFIANPKCIRCDPESYEIPERFKEARLTTKEGKP